MTTRRISEIAFGKLANFPDASLLEAMNSEPAS